jgi:hypothetical protein
LPATKSRDHGTFVEHFCETSHLGRLDIDGVLHDSNADTDMIASMIAGTDLATGRSITRILNRTGLIPLAGKSPHGTLRVLPPIPELMEEEEEDDDDDGDRSYSHSGGSPATPITKAPYISTSMRCHYCCDFLECLFIDYDVDGKHRVYMHYADCTCKKT